MYILGLGDSVTIIIVSVTIMTAIAKTAIRIVDIWLHECIFDIFLSQNIHNHEKKHGKIARTISDEINLDKKLEMFFFQRALSVV